MTDKELRDVITKDAVINANIRLQKAMNEYLIVRDNAKKIAIGCLLLNTISFLRSNYRRNKWIS